MFQAERWVHHTGKEFGGNMKVVLRSRFGDPEVAMSADECDEKPAEWKPDIAKLAIIDPRAVTGKHRDHPLWQLVPETVQDHFTNRGFSPDDWGD